jgi:hypothetical protein
VCVCGCVRFAVYGLWFMVSRLGKVVQDWGFGVGSRVKVGEGCAGLGFWCRE